MTAFWIFYLIVFALTWFGATREIYNEDGWVDKIGASFVLALMWPIVLGISIPTLLNIITEYEKKEDNNVHSEN